MRKRRNISSRDEDEIRIKRGGQWERVDLEEYKGMIERLRPTGVNTIPVWKIRKSFWRKLQIPIRGAWVILRELERAGFISINDWNGIKVLEFKAKSQMPLNLRHRRWYEKNRTVYSDL